MTTATATKTTVECVRGHNPEVWRADPLHWYVGRDVFLRSGKYQGKRWGNSCFGNPFKVTAEMDRAARVECLWDYCRQLKDKLNAHSQLREEFLQLRGKVLGCWCRGITGWPEGSNKPVPLCHAAWLARIVDLLAIASTGVAVERDGLIRFWHGEEVNRESVVTFKRIGRITQL